MLLLPEAVIICIVVLFLGDDDLKKVCTEVGSKMHQSNLYFVFYSAGSIDVIHTLYSLD